MVVFALFLIVRLEKGDIITVHAIRAAGRILDG
jgi:hypothetical protein